MISGRETDCIVQVKSGLSDCLTYDRILSRNKSDNAAVL